MGINVIIVVGLLLSYWGAYTYMKKLATQQGVRPFPRERRMYSSPPFYGILVVLIQLHSVLISLAVGCALSVTEPVQLLILGLFFLGSGAACMSFLNLVFPARKWVERCIKGLLRICAIVAVLVTVAIGFTLIAQTFRFFRYVPLVDFLTGTQWSPTTGAFGAGASFGILPLFSGTAMIAGIAMIVAVPLGIFLALFLSQYATKKQRTVLKPVLEVLSGIPSIVYGFFAVAAVSPFLKYVGDSLGISVQSENALGAGLVMGVMIIPYMSALSEDVLRGVPVYLKHASLALGATKAETIWKVVLPTAFPGLMGAFLLSLSRALGETMLVVMALGLTANLTANPLHTVTAVTVQIVNLLTGDQVFESPGPLSAFALGLILFLITLGLNVVAFQIVKRQRKRYAVED